MTGDIRIPSYTSVSPNISVKSTSNLLAISSKMPPSLRCKIDPTWYVQLQLGISWTLSTAKNLPVERVWVIWNWTRRHLPMLTEQLPTSLNNKHDTQVQMKLLLLSIPPTFSGCRRLHSLYGALPQFIIRCRQVISKQWLSSFEWFPSPLASRQYATSAFKLTFESETWRKLFSSAIDSDRLVGCQKIVGSANRLVNLASERKMKLPHQIIFSGAFI